MASGLNVAWRGIGCLTAKLRAEPSTPAMKSGRTLYSLSSSICSEVYTKMLQKARTTLGAGKGQLGYPIAQLSPVSLFDKISSEWRRERIILGSQLSGRLL